MYKIYPLIFFIFLFGCVSTQSTKVKIEHEQLSNYLINNYEKEILFYLKTVLKDPDSLKAFKIISKPQKGFLNYGAFSKGPAGKRFGNPMWYVCASYNAKNSYGAYVGSKTYAFFFYNSKVVRSVEGLSDYGSDFGNTKYDCR